MKKIIALAVASAFVAPAVMAEVTVYGYLAPSIEYSKVDNAGNATDVSRVRLVDNASRIGFKGTNKLDNGMTAFWQVENRVRVGNGDFANTGWNTRETFVGVQGNFGKVFVGQHNDLVWQSRPDYMPGLNYFNETVDGAHKFANMGAEGRIPNIVQYETPVLGGFKAKAIYDFGDKTNAAGGKKVNGYQGTAMYGHKMFKIGATAKVVNNGTDTGDFEDGYGTVAPDNKLNSYIIGGTVTPIKGLDVSAMWSKKIVRNAGVEVDQKAIAVGANYLTGKHGFGVHYAQKGDLSSTADSGAKLVVAQYKYNLSKQTYVHASLGYGKGDTNSKVSYGTTKTTFSDLGNLTTTNDNKITTIATGIRTNF